MKELNDREAFELALVENVQRQTLDPIDEAKALQRYVLGYGWGRGYGCRQEDRKK